MRRVSAVSGGDAEVHGMRSGSDAGMAAAVLQMSLAYRGLLAVRSRTVGAVALGLVSSQLRTFSVRKEPELEENPFYRKYQDKIQQLRRSDPAAFVARMEQRKEQHSPAVGFPAQSVRSMEGKVTSSPDSEAVLKNKFLYALPRQDGYEFFVGQWTGTELHFTALTNIQTVGDSAQSQLILHHYRELQASKGIVLMMGECDSTFLKVEDARFLANQVQLFYASDQFKLVQSFNHDPGDFKYMAVISALEHSQ
ncbi:ATP synthase mitochondrial F1 complex assembly factor 1 isoform X2 [Ranitomeya imitator]|uniref:ATP synthase mitochondrial F1 complex assembly factor 1 isoform X2 n=1 Tax=Ranitomeya imitator TaxID=111125 RepID=UPI0037E89BD9